MAKKDLTLNSTKQEQWNITSQEVNSYEDALGKGIDSKIKELVVALRVFGFKTVMSCEGHFDWGLPYPWVEFEVGSAITLEDEEEKLRQDADNAQKSGLPEETIDDLYKKLHRFRKEALKPLRLEMARLFGYLSEFYQNHQVSLDSQIVVRRHTYSCRLEIHGGDIQDIRQSDEKVLNLKKYQQEMGLFADFLKTKFFKE